MSFSDCEQNLRLDFPLVLSGFTPSDNSTLQVWAGTGGVDCVSDASRTSTAGTPHPCWQVAAFVGPLITTASSTLTVSVFARDVLRYEFPPSGAVTSQAFNPTFSSSSEGEQACHVQPTDAAVPITLSFLAVSPSDSAIGTSLQYSLSTDLVAPPPPCSVTVQGGGDLVDVAWTGVDADPDRTGFAVWSATTGDGGCDALAANTVLLPGPASQPMCQRAGISRPPLPELAGTVDNPTASSFTQTGLHAGERYVVGVASVDGTGNVGPLSSPECASADAPASIPKTVTAGCGCTASGARGPTLGALALGAVALALARLRRARRLAR